MMQRRGVCLPLSAMPSSGSWGIGEIPDLVPMGQWLQAASCDVLMLLPVGTMSPGQSSPYSACSAMSIDPIYLSVPALEDFVRAGVLDGLPDQLQHDLDAARAGDRVRVADVRRIKDAALRMAFDRFIRDEWDQHTVRAGEFAAFTSRERWWLDDYALFQACAAEWPGASWRDWPEPVARRQPAALAEVRRHFTPRILFEQYVQWVAGLQWHAARMALHASGVSLFGDLPFVVDAHSADVWARQDEFVIDISVGTPPDAFSATGQDWGLPMYRWDEVHRSGFEWLRQRARRMTSLYDGFRVDHLVGFYRTYGRTPDGDRFFLPPDEPTQLWQGQEAMRAFLGSGVPVVAEDLGTVPDFVRASLARMDVCGYKVLRWEREWPVPGRPFVSPADYPVRSVATTGTHDVEPMAAWWDQAAPEDRHALADVLHRAGLGAWDPAMTWSNGLRDAIIRLLAGAASDYVLFPIQDVFGWRDRINTPNTIGDHNWTWRLPVLADAWPHSAETRERAAFLREIRAAAGSPSRTA